MGTSETGRSRQIAASVEPSLEDLNRQTPVPLDRKTGAQTSRKILGLTGPTRLPKSNKVFGTLKWAVSHIEGGKQGFIELCRMAASEDSEVCLAVVTKYDTLTKKEQREVAIDDLVEALNIKGSELIGDVAATMFEYSADVSKLLASLAQPTIVERTLKNAAKASPDYLGDRKLALTATGFLPTPHGPRIGIGIRVGDQPQPPVEDGSGMPSFEERIKRGARTIRGDEF